MAVIDYASRIYGQQNKPTATSMTSYNTGDYETLYNQARALPLSGSAAGSADWLANYAQRSAQAQTAGMAPVSFNALLGPEGTVNTNAQVPNTGKTLLDVFNEAEAEYLARAAQQRDLARQGIMAAGQDRYQQARMAMEQQRALSDTRGLTAGAREGAEAQTSAAQQVALNQIEATTRSELLNLKAQGIQDEVLGQEYAMRKAEVMRSLSPQYGELELLMTNYQAAMQMGDTEKAQGFLDQYNQKSSAYLGIDLGEGFDYNNPKLSIDATRDKIIQRMNSNPTEKDKILSWVASFGSILGGTALGAVGFFLAPIGVGIPLMAAGATLVAYGTHLAYVAGDTNLSMERKKQEVDKILAEQRKDFIEMGYPAAEVDAAIEDYRQGLIPILQ